jgi:hypothetical protein
MYRIAVIDNGYVAMRHSTPVRHFTHAGDAMRWIDVMNGARPNCPATGHPCHYLVKVCSPNDEMIILWTCEMTGHEVDTSCCPLDDPNPRMPL